MKAAAIINSMLGRRLSLRVRSLLRSELGIDGCAVACTHYVGHAEWLARCYSRSGFDTIIACGGDGTVNEIVNGMDLTKTSLAILPVGTANDLANHYNIPANLSDALSVVKSGRAHRQDLIIVNGRRYTTVGGIGIGRQAIEITDLIRGRGWAGRALSCLLAHRLYCIGLALSLPLRKDRCVSACLKCNTVTIDGIFDSVVVGNQAMLGSQFKVLPDAVDDDGCFEAFTIALQNRIADLVTILMRVVKGKHPDSEHIHYIRGHKLTIQLDRPVQFFGDGEIQDFSEELEVEIENKALSVIVPSCWQNNTTVAHSLEPTDSQIQHA